MSTAILENPQIQEISSPTAGQPCGVAAPVEIEVKVPAAQMQEPHKRPLSAHDYMWMAENGRFEGQRVELIDGDIITMPPISEAHAQSVSKVTTKITVPLHERFNIRCQSPFNAGENGRPEPDIAVVRPESLSANEPPAQAILLVEISKATLQYDRTTKASLYASLGVPDYWIVNLVDNQVEVYRQPIESAGAQFGHDYASRQIYQRGQSVALLEAPNVAIEVNAMLP